MKDRVDKSRGIVTLIAETLTNIKPTETLSLVKPNIQSTEIENGQILRAILWSQY